MNHHSEKNRTKHEKDKPNIYCIENLLSFTSKVNNNNLEPFNVVAEDGDSIYTIPINECIGGQVYVSEDKIRDIVNEELDRRIGPSLINNHRNE